MAVAATVGACASTVGSGSPSTLRGTPITAAEIAESSATNAYDLVQSRRPAWLRRRGATRLGGADDILVYLDGARMGGIDALRQITTGSIAHIEFLDPAAATYRFGQGHQHGAIVLSSRRTDKDVTTHLTRT